MTNYEDLFTTFRQVEDIITVAGGRQLTSHGQGTTCIRFEGEGTGTLGPVRPRPSREPAIYWTVSRERYDMPIQPARSISTPRRRDASARQEGWKELCPLPTRRPRGANNSWPGQRPGQGPGRRPKRHQQEKELDAYTLWHRRLGHAGKGKMKLFQAAVEGIPALAPG
jgi:hypothetical protein